MKMITDLGMEYPKEGSKKKRHLAIYECPLCGRHFRSHVSNVNQGTTGSCGCTCKDKLLEATTRHGLSRTSIYRVYMSMKSRCFNPRNRSYHRYGGRGITVCDEWRNDFMTFYKWATANGYSGDLQIDRIDNDGNYCPENCRWATRSVNQQNIGKQKNNTSGYKGVFFDRYKWRVGVYSDGAQHWLGSYNTPKEAAIAYNNWVIEHKTAHKLNEIT